MLTGCQKDRTTCQKTDWQTDRRTDRQIEDKTTFQPSYQNKSCSECQQDVRKIERQSERQTDRRTDRKTDRQIFQLSYQNKSCSECRKDVKKSVRQTGRYTVQTEWQNDSMTVWQHSRAAKEPALVDLDCWLLYFKKTTDLVAVISVESSLSVVPDCQLVEELLLTFFSGGVALPFGVFFQFRCHCWTLIPGYLSL